MRVIEGFMMLFKFIIILLLMIEIGYYTKISEKIEEINENLEDINDKL